MAEGFKQSTVLASEASMARQTNEAIGEAKAILARAEATAKAIRTIAEATRLPVSVRARDCVITCLAATKEMSGPIRGVATVSWLAQWLVRLPDRPLWLS